MVLYIHRKRKGIEPMKLYSVVYETEYAIDSISFDTIKEVNAFFTEYGNEIQHYTLFKHNAVGGYTAIIKN